MIPLKTFSKFLLILFAISSCTGRKIKNERYYNHLYCQKINGTEEFLLDDNTRIDCLTDEYAIEMDWAKKWYEGTTQALYYGMKSGKKPKLVLIVKSKDDEKFIERFNETKKYYRLPVELERTGD